MVTVISATSTPMKIAEAAVDVVARGGFDRLSVRTVAQAAGVAAGTVQHHYSTRTQLLLAAFDHTIAAVSARITITEVDESLALQLGRLLRQILPLDDQRMRECLVWVTLCAAAPHHPELADSHARAVGLLRSSLIDLLHEARQSGRLDPTVDPAAAAGVLAAVVDGLTLQGLAGATTRSHLTSVLDVAIALTLSAGRG